MLPKELLNKRLKGRDKLLKPRKRLAESVRRLKKLLALPPKRRRKPKLPKEHLLRPEQERRKRPELKNLKKSPQEREKRPRRLLPELNKRD